MADFYQNGAITTLQNLGNRPIEELESELKTLCWRKRKTVLLLPALYSEFETPSMPRMIEELTRVGYLYRVVLSLDRAERRQFETARRLLSVLPTDVKIVWHDGNRVQKLYKVLKKNDFKLDLPGKGRSVWMTIGYILSDPEVYAMALHDCDILNYSREILARLVYPVVHPACDFEFSKGYYARVTDKLYGRVTRLFYTPLIRTLNRILGYNAFIDYLDSFRYALSGEFAFVSNLARSIRISPTWGLEVSMLSEVYQLTSANRICQVEIAQSYEHKHQVLRKDKPDQGLIRMATDIAKALFRVLSHDGIVMSEAFFRTLLTAYIQESRIVIEKYHGLSLLNGLAYDRHAEIEASEVFVGSLKAAIREFTADPVGIPMLAAWVRVNAALPDFSERLAEAVDLDNRS
jgi:glucosyl-3-phosphoglycerate synthase